MLILILIFSLFCSTTAKEFPGFCPHEKLKKYGECVNKELFEPQNSSNNFNYFQVIASMEFENVKGITFFYTYFTQNLVAKIEHNKNIFSINCWPLNGNSSISHINYLISFEPYEKCNVLTNKYIIFPSTMNFGAFLELTRGEYLYYVTKRDEYLVFWGCTEKNDLKYDLAAWILFNSNLMMVENSQELKNYLKNFLALLSKEISLNFTERDFKINKWDKKSKTCENDTNLIYKKIKMDVEELKDKHDKTSLKSTQYKFAFAFTFFIMLMAIIGLYYIISTLIINRCRVSVLDKL